MHECTVSSTLPCTQNSHRGNNVLCEREGKWEEVGGGGEEDSEQASRGDGSTKGGGRSARERENKRGGLQRAEKRPTGVFRRIAARLV